MIKVKEMGAPKAAICIIANEVLTGKTHDSNSYFLAQFLFRRGIDLLKIVVIPDIEEEIVKNVQELSAMVGKDGYVFTSGGIGPTHDDITYESVAKAFGKGVKLHEPTFEALLREMKEKYPDMEMDDEKKRMAILPENCQVLSTGTWVPLAVEHNVYILPGIPSLLKQMVTANEEHFKGVPIHRRMVRSKMPEGEIAKDLKSLQKQFSGVAIGSYINTTDPKSPDYDGSYNLKVCIEGRNLEEVEKVKDLVIDKVQGYVHESD